MILTPNTDPNNAAIAQAEKTTTKPIRALVTWFLALSVAPLSPPERIHLIPPSISMKKKIKPATTSIILRPQDIIAGIVIFPKPLKSAGADKFILPAANTVDKVAINKSPPLTCRVKKEQE